MQDVQIFLKGGSGVEGEQEKYSLVANYVVREGSNMRSKLARYLPSMPPNCQTEMRISERKRVVGVVRGAMCQEENKEQRS